MEGTKHKLNKNAKNKGHRGAGQGTLDPLARFRFSLLAKATCYYGNVESAEADVD